MNVDKVMIPLNTQTLSHIDTVSYYVLSILIGDAMQNEGLKEYFINYLIYGVDDYFYDYNEKEITKEWY